MSEEVWHKVKKFSKRSTRAKAGRKMRPTKKNGAPAECPEGAPSGRGRVPPKAERGRVFCGVGLKKDVKPKYVSEKLPAHQKKRGPHEMPQGGPFWARQGGGRGVFRGVGAPNCAHAAFGSEASKFISFCAKNTIT